MFKLSGLLGIGMAALLLTSGPVNATPLASHAGFCASGDGPALLVQVSGFKVRQGMLRIQSYGGSPDDYFEKGRYLDRIDVAVPRTGKAQVCVPVTRAGNYAVSVRHDLDGDRKTGRSDGGGMSGNPRVSVADLLFKRKPPAAAVTVRVGEGVSIVPVTLNYIQGMSFRPAYSTAGL